MCPCIGLKRTDLGTNIGTSQCSPLAAGACVRALLLYEDLVLLPELFLCYWVEGVTKEEDRSTIHAVGLGDCLQVNR